MINCFIKAKTQKTKRKKINKTKLFGGNGVIIYVVARVRLGYAAGRKVFCTQEGMRASKTRFQGSSWTGVSRNVFARVVSRIVLFYLFENVFFPWLIVFPLPHLFVVQKALRWNSSLKQYDTRVAIKKKKKYLIADVPLKNAFHLLLSSSPHRRYYYYYYLCVFSFTYLFYAKMQSNKIDRFTSSPPRTASQAILFPYTTQCVVCTIYIYAYLNKVYMYTYIYVYYSLIM